MKLRFLSIDIFYNNTYRKCANGGKSETFERGFILCPEGNYTPIDLEETDAPIYKMFVKEVYAGDPYKYVVECDILGEPLHPKGQPMAGGNFIYSCDSRYRRLSAYPVSIHDRIE